jgi:hypothetical protein
LCNNLLIYIYRRYRSKFDIEWSLSVRRKFCHFTAVTICYYMWWCCCNFFLTLDPYQPSSPGTIWKISWHNRFITYYTLTFSKYCLLYCKKDLWTEKLRKRRKFCHFTAVTICYYMWWCCCNLFLDIYIYVIKFNSTVLELDLWADKFGFSLQGIWTHAIDTLEHQTLSLMLVRFCTSECHFVTPWNC